MKGSQFKLSLKIAAAVSFLGSLLMVLANIWEKAPHVIRYYHWKSNTWFVFNKVVFVWSPENLGLFMSDIWRLVQFLFTIMIRQLDKIASQIFLPNTVNLFPSFYDNIIILEYYAELFTSRVWFYPYPLSLFLNSFQMEYLVWPNLWTIVLSDLAINTLWSFYYFLFPLLLIVAIITGAVFVWKIRMRYLVSSFICMQTLLALAALTQIINIGQPSNTPFFGTTSFFTELLYGGAAGAAIAFLTSPLFFAALICYLYLEIGFQVIYMDEVTSPALERRKMIEEQLKVVEEIATSPEELVIEGEKETRKDRKSVV